MHFFVTKRKKKDFSLHNSIIVNDLGFEPIRPHVGLESHPIGRCFAGLSLRYVDFLSPVWITCIFILYQMTLQNVECTIVTLIGK